MWCVDCWTVHYEGSLAETGEVFDTTHVDNTIFTFQLGKGPVIKAWDVAFRTMKVFFYLAAQVSNPPHISCNFIFEVELVASPLDERARLE
uniref:peptidylprolyl isomerase n=1 Tax=Helianthus annuus TaxID=4232 RepID=A0A251UFF0_HELAN